MMKHSNLLLPLLLLPLFLFSSCGNSGDKPAADTTHKADSLYNINAMIRKDPGNLDLYVRRARISMAQKDYASAMNDMNRVLTVVSSKAEYLLAAADVNFFTMHTARTKQLLERAVEVNPENVDCLLQLAQLYHYFADKDALVLEVIALQTDRVLGAQQPHLRALDSLEAHLAGNDFLLGDAYTVADMALYGYTHVAHEVVDMDGRRAIAAWIERVEAQPRFMNDLRPLP